MWGQVSETEASAAEEILRQESGLWGSMVAGGSFVRRFDESKHGAEAMLQCLVEKSPVVLRVQMEVAISNKAVIDTDAGIAIQEYLEATEELEMAEKLKGHLLAPETYFTRLQDLEDEVTKSYNIANLFSPDGQIYRSFRNFQDIDSNDIAAEEQDLSSSLATDTECRELAKILRMMNELRATEKIMARILRAFDLLQESDFCGDGFNLIVGSSSRSGVIEVIPISLTVLLHLGSLVREATTCMEQQKPSETAREILFMNLKERLLCLESASRKVSQYLGLEHDLSDDRLSRTLSLMLMLSFGLTSHSGSHASRFDRNCFGTSAIDSFEISLPWIPVPILQIKQEGLACLADFVGGPVWVIRKAPSVGANTTCQSENLVVSVSVRELADL